MTAADPEGRVRHLLDVMHKTFDDAGDPIPSGMVPVADGLGQVDYVDSSTFGSGLPWFIVTAYGAVGDGTTDDTTAINAAIAALVSAGRGVLYFPAGTYKTTAALTALSVPCLVLGDGSSYGDGTAPVSEVTCTSTTANLFTSTAKAVRFEKLALRNTAGGTPSAGSGISVQSSVVDGHTDFEGLLVVGFWIDIDVQVAAAWSMHACILHEPVKYALKIQNTTNGDAGDWSISNSLFLTTAHAADSAIRIESSGGGKIVNCKINAATNIFGIGVDMAIPTSVNTLDFLISNTSIENVSADAIKITTTGAGSYAQIVINGIQVGLFSNNTGRAVNIVAASAGGHVSGGIADIMVDSCVFMTDGTARAAVAITNVDNITFGDLTLVGFNARYTATTSTNITDGGGATTLAALTDVTLTSPAVADRLRYDGSVWRNSALIWRPVTTYDGATGLWVPLVDGSGNAIMAEA